MEYKHKTTGLRHQCVNRINTPEEFYHNEVDILYARILYGDLKVSEFLKQIKELDKKYGYEEKNYKD
jgi:hypothetical protein